MEEESDQGSFDPLLQVTLGPAAVPSRGGSMSSGPASQPPGEQKGPAAGALWTLCASSPFPPKRRAGQQAREGLLLGVGGGSEEQQNLIGLPLASGPQAPVVQAATPIGWAPVPFLPRVGWVAGGPGHKAAPALQPLRDDRWGHGLPAALPGRC